AEVIYMSKKLSEMTLEELWQLFPIILTAPDPRWNDWYAQEEALLRSVLPEEFAAAIHHIGSTSIPGIYCLR
ncbi:MAG: GrpB family protein, partial [Alistipes sp.]|nr:GrpB family protein [Alistipes sp.]